MAKGNNEFVVHMLNTFIDNAEVNLKKLEGFLSENNWEQIGETVHRMLPSFRHLGIQPVITDLVEIKDKVSDNNPGAEEISSLMKHVAGTTQKVIFDLEKEIKRGLQQE